MPIDNKLKTATVKETGKVIKVYRLIRGPWCDFADCKTEYEEKDLIFKK